MELVNETLVVIAVFRGLEFEQTIASRPGCHLQLRRHLGTSGGVRSSVGTEQRGAFEHHAGLRGRQSCVRAPVRRQRVKNPLQCASRSTSSAMVSLDNVWSIVIGNSLLLSE